MTRKQAKYIYKKVETEEMINKDTIQQEIEQKRQLDKMDDTNRETNPYQELIVNNAERIEPLMTQMEQWSIFEQCPKLCPTQQALHNKSYLGYKDCEQA